MNCEYFIKLTQRTIKLSNVSVGGEARTRSHPKRPPVGEGITSAGYKIGRSDARPELRKGEEGKKEREKERKKERTIKGTNKPGFIESDV